MLFFLGALLGCGGDERQRVKRDPFADPRLGIAADDLAVLRSVPKRIGSARKDEASACAAVHATLVGAETLREVLATHPKPEDRPLLRALVRHTPGLAIDIPADEARAGVGTARVDWPALAEATGPNAPAVLTWGAWLGRPPWGDAACIEPGKVAPWLGRMKSAMAMTCLTEALAPQAIASWERLANTPCWCAQDPAAVVSLADLGERVPGFAKGAAQLRSGVSGGSGARVRLDPKGCE